MFWVAVAVAAVSMACDPDAEDRMNDERAMRAAEAALDSALTMGVTRAAVESYFQAAGYSHSFQEIAKVRDGELANLRLDRGSLIGRYTGLSPVLADLSLGQRSYLFVEVYISTDETVAYVHRRGMIGK